MLPVLSVLKSPGPGRCAESFVFCLHFRITFLALVAACILVSTQDLFGDRIQCSTQQDRGVRPELINAYCWAASTYSVSTAYHKEVGLEIPHPGIGASENESEYIYRNYYQYIHMVLFLQALLFYLPHLIWKGIDRDPLKGLQDLLPKPQDTNKTIKASQDHNNTSKTVGNSTNSVNCKPSCNSPKDSHSAFDAAAAYIADRWSCHSDHALKYAFCELLALVNLLAQCYFLNVFLHGEFMGLGHFFTPYYISGHFNDPIQMFPLVTNCYFKKFGAPGFVDTVDAICVLPINALNVKIYLFLWMWFAVLLGLSLVSLLDLCLSWCAAPYRTLFLKWRLVFLRSRIGQASYLKVVDLGDFGDWFVLGCVRRDMDPLDFSRLMEVLWCKLSAHGIETKEA